MELQFGRHSFGPRIPVVFLVGKRPVFGRSDRFGFGDSRAPNGLMVSFVEFVVELSVLVDVSC